MVQDKLPRLTPAELEILDVLWELGPATIAETQARLPRKLGYTTVQTRLNRMVRKGLLRRSATRPARYRPKVSSQQVSSRFAAMAVDRAGDRQVVPLVAQLLRRRRLSAEELEQLRQLLDQLEQRNKRSTERS